MTDNNSNPTNNSQASNSSNPKSVEQPKINPNSNLINKPTNIKLPPKNQQMQNRLMASNKASFGAKRPGGRGR